MTPEDEEFLTELYRNLNKQAVLNRGDGNGPPSHSLGGPFLGQL